MVLNKRLIRVRGAEERREELRIPLRRARRPSPVLPLEGNMEIRGVDFYPDEAHAKWGYVLVQGPTLEDDSFDGRETWRLEDVARIRGLKAMHGEGVSVLAAGGTWIVRAGWPTDWDPGTIDDDDAWSEVQLEPVDDGEPVGPWE